MELQSLKKLSLDELIEVTEDLSCYDLSSQSRHDLILSILGRCSEIEEPVMGQGTLEIVEGGFGFLRCVKEAYRPSNYDIYVSPSQVKRFSLKTGDQIRGIVRQPRDNERYFALLKIEELNTDLVDKQYQRDCFDELKVGIPEHILNFEEDSSDLCVQAIDKLAPIALGQRAALLLDERTQHMLWLESILSAAYESDHRLQILVVCVNERAEEIKALEQALPYADIVGLPFGDLDKYQMRIADLTLEKSKRLAESGKDVLLCVSRFTQLAFLQPDSSSKARLGYGQGLNLCRKILGAARNLVGAGSITILGGMTVSPCGLDLSHSLQAILDIQIDLSNSLFNPPHIDGLSPQNTWNRSISRYLDSRESAKYIEHLQTIRSMSRQEAIDHLKELL
jgi:transcription termination factor Rho